MNYNPSLNRLCKQHDSSPPILFVSFWRRTLPLLQTMERIPSSTSLFFLLKSAMDATIPKSSIFLLNSTGKDLSPFHFQNKNDYIFLFILTPSSLVSSRQEASKSIR
eukprot:TRINITY_DN2866_c1_g1_i1.p1 TRINITY_DN2866_c1_g1~~TRINITY_DN2866_c1_g1_i1.p1  ORF type:complete len:107 (+),score=16.03 TRINITY_DN2866_c1_g1_i1:546-866(+)